MECSTSDLILFLHIPKSAGSTVHHFLNMQFGSEKVCSINWHENPDALRNYEDLTPAAKHQLRAVSGHFQFGLHEHLGRPSTYITMLRDPVDRVVSFYYFALANPDVFIHSTAAKMSLDEFVKCNAIFQLDNFQVRLLAGKLNAPVGTLTSIDVEQAKNNLHNHFSVVGVQDDVDAFLASVSQRFKIPNIRVPSQNRTRNRPSLERVASSTKETIKAQNALDQEIYEFVKNTLPPPKRWRQWTKQLRRWAHSTASFFPKMLRS
jgi:hypothetical protein